MKSNNEMKYFSIHSVKALENKVFSIVLGNIENTEEKIKIAKNLYNDENWYFEFHNYKINMNVVIN
jgi:hypothetical protein